MYKAGQACPKALFDWYSFYHFSPSFLVPFSASDLIHKWQPHPTNSTTLSFWTLLTFQTLPWRYPYAIKTWLPTTPPLHSNTSLHMIPCQRSLIMMPDPMRVVPPIIVAPPPKPLMLRRKERAVILLA